MEKRQNVVFSEFEGGLGEHLDQYFLPKQERPL